MTKDISYYHWEEGIDLELKRAEYEKLLNTLTDSYADKYRKGILIELIKDL